MAKRRKSVSIATSKAEEKLRRHQAIVAFLAASSQPRSTREVHAGVGGGILVLRTIQRDLQELLSAGTIDEEDGKWLAVGGRVEEELDRLLSVAALNVFKSILQESLPASLRRAVTSLLNQKARVLAFEGYENTPEVNWLRSLCIEPGYAWIEKPVIDRAVRAGIEEGITTRRKVWIKAKPLKYGPWWHQEGEILVSVSHYILTLPDRPAVVAWTGEDYTDVLGEHDVQSPQVVWPLEFIESVRVSDQPAEFDPLWEPETSHSGRLGDPDSSWTTYVLRIEPLFMEELTGTLILDRLLDASKGGGIIGIDDQGWTICRVLCPPDQLTEWSRFNRGLRQFMYQYAESIEVIEPFNVRMQHRAHARGVLARYEDAQDRDEEVVEALWLRYEADVIEREGQVLRRRYDPYTGELKLADGMRTSTKVEQS